MNSKDKTETIVVAGLGRCGSSLVMQMLAAAGFAVTGQYPAFEVEGFSQLSTGSMWSEEWKGKVIKVLDPHRCELFLDGCRIIWLRRNERQQARSILKFYSAVTGEAVNSTRASVRRLERSLVEDTFTCKRILRARSKGPWMELSFEDLILQPDKTAARLAEFVGGDPEVMAGVVRKRGTSCYPGLMEVELVEEQCTCQIK